ncbi:hypothetical protein ACIGMX_16355 [Streptomyces aquilus]|uniref:hypothetical protein n=1 Tax=Streptomyces aquilus TaxID=2548456 RepID=UPI0037D77339
MPHIKVLEAIAGADFSWAPGDIVELPQEQAEVWADGHRAEWAAADGAAVPVEQAPRVVTADGVELTVVAAVVEDFDAPGTDEDTPPHARWLVTVELPAAGPVPASADGTGQEPQQPAEAAGFDPADHKVDEVLDYLATATEEEALRVLDAEGAAKKPRTSIVGARDGVLAAARERAAAGEQQDSEKAAEDSRGGGRGDVYETR